MNRRTFFRRLTELTATGLPVALVPAANRLGNSAVCVPLEGIALEDIERQAVMQAMELAGGRLRDAARLLSISPRVMTYKLKTLRVPPYENP